MPLASRSVALSQHRHSTTRPPTVAKLFRNNGSQAVRIPVEFELPGDKVLISREGDRLIIEPLRNVGLTALLAPMGERAAARP